MNKVSLIAVSRGLLARAASVPAGRGTETVYGGHEHVLRQSVVVLSAHRGLAEHALRGEGTVYVLNGRVRLRAGREEWDARTGDFLVLPAEPHSIEALEDSAMLVTIAMPGRTP
jgi:quercetin dioxygenase-like cupin family protein